LQDWQHGSRRGNAGWWSGREIEMPDPHIAVEGGEDRGRPDGGWRGNSGELPDSPSSIWHSLHARRCRTHWFVYICLFCLFKIISIVFNQSDIRYVIYVKGARKKGSSRIYCETVTLSRIFLESNIVFLEMYSVSKQILYPIFLKTYSVSTPLMSLRIFTKLLHSFVDPVTIFF